MTDKHVLLRRLDKGHRLLLAGRRWVWWSGKGYDKAEESDSELVREMIRSGELKSTCDRGEIVAVRTLSVLAAKECGR